MARDSSAQVKAEIEAFGGVDSVLVATSRNYATAEYRSRQFTITFVGEAVAGNVPQLRVTDVGANGCTSPPNATAGHDVAKTLVDSFIPLYQVQRTKDLEYDASAVDVKDAIETLSGVCTVDVSRSVRANGFEWLVTFLDLRSDRLLRSMRPNSLLLDNIADHVEPNIFIVPILHAKLSTPRSGIPYYVRSAAINEVGVGTFRTSQPSSLQPAAQTPAAPKHATVAPVSDTEMSVQWEAPQYNGGETISRYYLEWDTRTTFDSAIDGKPFGSIVVDASEQDSVADVQAVRVSVDDAWYVSGSFFLEYNGQATGSIPFDASALEVERALEELCTVRDVAVTRQIRDTHGAFTWLVTTVAPTDGMEAGDGQMSTTSELQGVKSHKLRANGDNLLTCKGATRSECWSDPDCTSIGTETTREFQRLLCQSSTGFSLSFAGETTYALQRAANASEIEEALEGLHNVGDVSVTGSCDNSVENSFLYVRFENDAGDLPALSSSVDGDFEEVTKGSVQFVVGRKALSYTIRDIPAAVVPWTVRISAYNSVGHGEHVVATHDSSEMVLGGVLAPTLPMNVGAEIESARSAWIYWDAPSSDGGDLITEYVVDLDTSDGFDSTCKSGPEVQMITATAATSTHSGESFNLTFDGSQYLACVDWNSTPWVIQEDLRAGDGALSDVVVTRGGDGSAVWAYGYSYSVTFGYNKSYTALADVPEMIVESCGTGSDGVAFEVDTLRDGTEAKTSACQVEHLAPFSSHSVHAADAEGSGTAIQGTFSHLITGLSPAVSYRTRVAAVNSVAQSPWAFMGYPHQPSTFAPTSVPKIVRNVTVRSRGDSALHVGIGLPVGIDTHGTEGLSLERFRVEVARRIFEKQIVSLELTNDGNGTSVVYPTRGSYTLTVGDATTWCLDWGAEAKEVQLALDALATVDGVEVEVIQPKKYPVSGSNATNAVDSSRSLIASFTGPYLSNGDQDLMNIGLCTSLDAGAFLDVRTFTDGVAGSISPVLSVMTSSHNSSSSTLAGNFRMSFGYRADLGLRLGEGNETTVYSAIDAGSKIVRCSSDLSHYINKGDLIALAGVEMIVDGDFACEDSVAWDNTLAEYPCSFAVDSSHPHGAYGFPIYGASNSLGSVHVERGSTKVLTDWNLVPFLAARDTIILRDQSLARFSSYVVSSVSNDVVELAEEFRGPSMLRAAAFFSPFTIVPFDATAEEIRDALESLPSVGSVEVTRMGPDETNAFEWHVTFTSYDGPLSDAHVLRVESITSRALEVADCSEAGNGTYLATGEMVDGRMRYKLVDRSSYIEFDSSADNGLGRWIITADHVEAPYAIAVLGVDAPARDSLSPPTGSKAFWSTGCAVSIPSSPVVLLDGIVSSVQAEVGMKGSFAHLTKDVRTQPGLVEVQAIHLGASDDSLGGTFAVDFAASGGFAAAWDISASDMEVKTVQFCVGFVSSDTPSCVDFHLTLPQADVAFSTTCTKSWRSIRHLINQRRHFFRRGNLSSAFRLLLHNWCALHYFVPRDLVKSTALCPDSVCRRSKQAAKCIIVEA